MDYKFLSTIVFGDITYPKLFLEQFWNGGIQRSDEPVKRNDIFVCMPFSSPDDTFSIIKEIGEKLQFEVNLADTSHHAAVIEDKIWDGIANSKILLFDLSDDPKLTKNLNPTEKNCLANQNVCFEIGFATVIHEPEDILIIYQKSNNSKLPFNLSHFTHFEYNDEKELKEKLPAILQKLISNQEWSKSRLVKYTANLLDAGCFFLISEFTFNLSYQNTGEYPYTSFMISKELIDSLSVKMNKPEAINLHLSIMKLLELGLIWTNHSFEETPERDKLLSKLDSKYYWTNFGKAIARHVKKKEV